MTRAEENKEEKEKKEKKEKRDKREKIVIIDDEKRMADSLTSLLTADGYSVRSFQDSREAIELIRSERVDLVISDIKMPRMDGLEILREIKKIDDGIPVILMTGYGSLETAIDAIGRGAYDYLLKPVEYAHLELTIDRALDKRRSELAMLHLMEELKLSNLILNRRVGELNALYEAGKSIGSALDLKELLRQLVALASAVTEAKVGSIMLLDQRNEYLSIEAAIGLDDDIITQTKLPIGASIAGYVAQTGEALIVKDVENDDRFKRINRERYGPASLLCTPLKIGANILGVINMARKEDGADFTQDDLRLLSTFASQAAVAVDDANQFRKGQRRLVEFEILHDIASEMTTIKSWVAFRELLIDRLSRVFPVDYGIWFIWDQPTRTLVPRGAIGLKNIPQTESGKIDLSNYERAEMVIDNLRLDEVDLTDIQALSLMIGDRVRDLPHYPKPKEAYMAVPVTKGGQVAYLFYLGSEQENGYSDEDASLARLVISQSAVLFERETTMLNATRLITMGNMISEISHDLRKPLTGIRGMLQILKKRWPEIAKDSEIIKMVDGEIHRMNELVRELVDFSNPNKYQMTRTDLRDSIARAADLVAPEMRKKNIQFEAIYQDLNWEILINKNQVMEMFLNLFMNAIDSISGSGILKVEGLAEQPEHKSEPYLAVRVIDDGAGITKENLHRIFERYYTSKETGTGLGLSVVERIISTHNGTLHVASELGKGTTFTVYFPMNSLS